MKSLNDKILSVYGRLVTFLFVFSFLVISLIVLGNFQSFLDRTMSLLMRIYILASLIFIVMAFFYIIILVLAGKSEKRNRPLRIFIISVGIAVNLAVYFITSALLVFIQPVSGI